jgi:hypothetical protein
LRRSPGQAEYVGRGARSRQAEGARMEESFDLRCHLLPPLRAGQSQTRNKPSSRPACHGQAQIPPAFFLASRRASPESCRFLPPGAPYKPQLLPAFFAAGVPSVCSHRLPPCAPAGAASRFTRRGRPRCSHCLAPKLLRRRVVSPWCQPCGPSSLPLLWLSFPDPA